ncbi:MAG: hypothetical protein AB7Q17_16900 [Phycisphaerae bacterium]
MQGCIAPSEIPGVSSQEASVFGQVAEALIFADFCTQYVGVSNQVFWDQNNPAAYLYFLASNNPQFTERLQRDFYARLRAESLMFVPDILVHKPDEKAFYEIKPDSTSGMAAGVQKVGTLRAVYPYYQLPYVAGERYTPRDHNVAGLGQALRATLRVRRVAPGLIVYKLCLDAEGELALATLAVLLAYIVRQMNQQRNSGQFRPIDLRPAFQSNQQLADLARTLGLTFATAATAAAGVAVVRSVGWRHFWKAVIVRFALRGAAALGLAAVDGPLPIGDLVAVGLTIWTVVDIVRLSDELWVDAARIAREEA